MSKLIVAYIVEKDEDVFELSYNSIKNVADSVVIIDGNKHELLYPIEKGVQLHSPYPHELKEANGKQRNKYIRELQNLFEGDWCLVLDADEVVDKPEMIKKTIEELEKQNIDCASIHMRHFIGNLANEDATQEQHFVPCRLFKVTKDLSYPEVEHPVLQGFKTHAHTNGFCVWHLAYAREMFRLKNKYNNHMEKSNIHTPQYLEQWYHAHLLGEYPVKKVDPQELPKVIKDHFQMNDDYLYFRNRTVELKHAECVKQWNEYFKPISVFELGCGRGPYLRYWEMNCECSGIELSEWAVNNKICNSEIMCGDLLEEGKISDLMTAIDVLEHLEEKELSIALKNMITSANKFLFSIPFDADPELGLREDPNLRADSTHKIFKPKRWWIEQLESNGFKIEETPKDFHFREQIIIATKGDSK